MKELRLAKVSSITEGNTFLESFRRDYNARFGRIPASDHDAHRKLIKAERARLDDIFCWQESRGCLAVLQTGLEYCRWQRGERSCTGPQTRSEAE